MINTNASQRLTYFTFYWAIVAVMEQMFHNHSWFFKPTDQIFIVSIILAVCFPHRVASLVFLATAGLMHLFLATITPLNNIILEDFINFTVLVVIGLSFVKRKSWKMGHNEIYLKIAPLLRIFLITLYFFAFFVKLNTDFFNPEVSCVVKTMDQFLIFWFGITQMPWPKEFVIYGTLFTEFSLPLMLIFKRTRNTAIVLGLLFHLALGFMVAVWGFSLLMGMLYFVFLSEESFDLIQLWGGNFKDLIKRAIPHTAIRVLAISTMVYVSLYGIRTQEFKMFCYWLVLYSFVMFVFIFSIFLSRQQGPVIEGPQERNYFMPRPAYLLALVLPLLICGFAPFLGLRTYGVIEIFSNLRTLGPKPNHFILGPSFIIFKQGLVKVLDSNNPRFRYYIYNHFLITEYEFRRIANSIHGSFYVRCIYQGKVIVVRKTKNGPNDHPLLKPIPWVEQKFIRFHDVDELEHCRCAEGLNGFFPPRRYDLMNQSITYSRLTYFTFLWALAALMEQVYHYRLWYSNPTDYIFIIAIILAICFPKKLATLVFLASAGLVHLFIATTTSLNNIIFEDFINFTILAVVGLSFVNRKQWGFENKDIYLKFVPIVRIFLIATYLYAFFGKLNVDFLNLNESCSVRVIELFLKEWFGATLIPWFKLIAIYGTLVTEFSVPVMLMFKRTRNIAIVIGLGFHLVLGFMVQVWGFSMLMSMLYFVFLSDESLSLIQVWGEKAKNIIQKAIPTPVLRVLAVSMLIYGSLSFVSERLFDVFCFWLVLNTFILVIFIFSILFSRYQAPSVDVPKEAAYFLPRPAYLLVLALPLLFCGIEPYLGLRTEGCIGIFNNLRTLGPKPNHLILGPSFVIFKQGLVKVLNTNNPQFRYFIQNHYLLTEYEFRRLANLIPGGFYVRCLYQGKEIVVHKTKKGPNDHPLLKPVPWLEQKLIRFRNVDELEHCRCQESLRGIFPKKNKYIDLAT